MDFDTDPLAYAAASRPTSIAVIDLTSGERLTYAALDTAVGRLSAWLGRQFSGAPEGKVIAYIGRNGIEFLATALAVERCGAIFAPLNWRLAAPELTALLSDCEPALVIAQPEFVPLLSEARCVTDVRRHADAGIAGSKARRLPPQRPAILLYTSGTTGTPKGVVLTARNAYAQSVNFIAVGQLPATCVTFTDLPMFHQIGLIAVARSTLMVGGTLVLTDRFDAARSMSALADRALGISHYFAVPLMVAAMTRDPAFDPVDLRGLSAIFLGGAPLSPSLIERFLAFGVPLVNGYGMSEVGTSIHVPPDVQSVGRSGGAVGIPAPHVEVRLVRDEVDVSAGEIGEVWLRGPSVSAGYWRRPEETKASFVDGWYRTGDLAEIRDGMYHIVDRLKDMYISGGENVYPAEVEAVLQQHPAVADAAVVSAASDKWGETGVAFVASKMGMRADVGALQAHCVAHLAKYKCPSRFIIVDTIPRSPSGKLLKQMLRAQLSIGEKP
jgi:fatty-acyl-CoA synthase